MTLGVFDSGVGGLTVLREIRALLPDATLVYIGDSQNAPYGPRSESEIQALSLGQARFLLSEWECAALVVACNTATAAAIQLLRETFPELPVVGMEPAVKPAVAVTKTRVVGVLATVGTLKSAKLAALLERDWGPVKFVTHACPGWVEAVERGELDSPRTRQLIANYVTPLIYGGADTLVLGCTHFPALRSAIQEFVGPTVTLIDTGEAVARRVVEVTSPPQPSSPGHSYLVGEGGGRRTGSPFPERDERQGEGQGVRLYTTGSPATFAVAAGAILGLDAPPTVEALVWKEGELAYAESGR